VAAPSTIGIVAACVYVSLAQPLYLVAQTKIRFLCDAGKKQSKHFESFQNTVHYLLLEWPNKTTSVF
jgi:hypothetical protein